MPVGWRLSIDLRQCELDGVELRPTIANRIPALGSGYIILSGRSSWPVFPSHRSALSAIQRAANKFSASIGGASCAILHKRRRSASLSLGLKLPFQVKPHLQVKPHRNASVAWGCPVRLGGVKKRSYLLAAPFIVIAVHGVRSPDRMNQRMIDSQIVDFGKRQHVQAHFG
jgi:hypothetical protein